MSDAYQTKFNYTAGGEFLLDGQNYTGLFNVYSDATTYSGKYRTNASKLLTPLSNFSAEFHQTAYFKDRFAFDRLELPNPRSSVEISLNELVNFTTINTKLKYLHDNLLYLYSQMFVGDTDVPYAYDLTAGISSASGTYTWHDTPNNYSFGYSTFAASSSLSAYAEMDHLKRFVVIPFEDASGFSILGITTTHLIGLTSNADFSSISLPLLYTNVVDNFSEEKCQNLTDITYDGYFLYVTDSSINSGGQVFKYDIPTYNTGDPAFEGNRFLIKPLGGLGGKKDKNKFKGCGVIGSKPGVIFVADNGNGSIKVYNKDLVWLKTIRLPKGSYEVRDIKHRAMTDHMHVLARAQDAETGAYTYIMLEYDEDLKLVSRVVFIDDLLPEIDGAFHRMVFSEQDSNVFYLITDSTVYKKFFSKPTTTFATFKRDKFGQSPLFKWNYESIWWMFDTKLWNTSLLLTPLVFSDIAILPNDEGVDSLFVLGNGLLLHFSEQNTYRSILREPVLPFYGLNKVLLEQTENIQSVTINKELYKMYSNIVQLKNTIKGRFSYLYDGYGDLNFKNYMYFVDDEIDRLKVEINLNTRVNDNELVQAGTMNKLLMQVYDLHEALLELTKPVIVNYRNIISNDNILVID
jgi:hypothetical protein